MIWINGEKIKLWIITKKFAVDSALHFSTKSTYGVSVLLKLKISPFLWEKEFAVSGFEKVVLARKSENAIPKTGWSASGCFANVLYSI